MPLPDMLEQFDRLDKNSSQFQDQPTSLLYSEELEDYIPEFRDEDTAWLVKYLDQLCLSITLYPHSVQPA